MRWETLCQIDQAEFPRERLFDVQDAGARRYVMCRNSLFQPQQVRIGARRSSTEWDLEGAIH